MATEKRPERDDPAAPRKQAEPTSSYLASELGALWAFLSSKHEPTQPSRPTASSNPPDRATPAPPTRPELEARLAERVWTDDAFRADLLADPTAVIRRELAALGLALPRSVRVHVHEETPATLHLVLPFDPGNVDLELDDEVLDLVAGGSGEGAIWNCL